MAKDCVKYLGVTLDRKLHWNRHLEAQVRRFHAAFWLCRRAFGSTWGLRPSIMLWLYRAVLLPRITYASVVWWPKVEQRSVLATLEKLRGLVLRGAVGAMRTAPTAALGRLLDVPPLHLEVKGRAITTAYRLRLLGQARPGTRHMKLPLLEDPLLGMRADTVPPRYWFETCWETLTPSREEWLLQGEELPGTEEVWYTDGSRSEERSGAGYYCRRDGKGAFLCLGRYATVFQTEIMAILRCAQRIEELSHTSKQITICTDSRAALGALSRPATTSELVWECKKALARLFTCNTIRLM